MKDLVKNIIMTVLFFEQNYDNWATTDGIGSIYTDRETDAHTHAQMHAQEMTRVALKTKTM